MANFDMAYILGQLNLTPETCPEIGQDENYLIPTEPSVWHRNDEVYIPLYPFAVWGEPGYYNNIGRLSPPQFAVYINGLQFSHGEKVVIPECKGVILKGYKEGKTVWAHVIRK